MGTELMKSKFFTFTFLLVASTCFATEFSPQLDYIRPVDELLGDASHIDLILVEASSIDQCPFAKDDGLITYKGSIRKTYKSARQEKKITFCGYSGLSVNRSYVIAFQDYGSRKGLFFSPDAVFLQRLPSEFYRLLSFESNLRTVEGTPTILSGRKVADLETLLRKSK